MLDLSISKELRLIRFNINIATSTIAAICLIIMFILAPTPFAISQVPDTTKYGVKITYPSDGETVSDGELTIFGTGYGVTDVIYEQEESKNPKRISNICKNDGG